MHRHFCSSRSDRQRVANGPEALATFADLMPFFEAQRLDRLLAKNSIQPDADVLLRALPLIGHGARLRRTENAGL